MDLQPLGDRVVAKRVEAEEKRDSGIVIPESAQDTPTQAEVVAVGPGKRENGSIQEPEVEEGDRIVFGEFSGTEINLNGNEYLVLSSDDILCKVE